MQLNLLKRFCSISPRCVCSYSLSSITRVPATARASSSTATVTVASWLGLCPSRLFHFILTWLTSSLSGGLFFLFLFETCLCVVRCSGACFSLFVVIAWWLFCFEWHHWCGSCSTSIIISVFKVLQTQQRTWWPLRRMWLLGINVEVKIEVDGVPTVRRWIK